MIPFSVAHSDFSIVFVSYFRKPHGSKVHFQVTTCEPYGVCCLSGAKVSMGMHNFGERRWRNGIIDDIRSQTDQNTRIIGESPRYLKEDFEKFFLTQHFSSF